METRGIRWKDFGENTSSVFRKVRKDNHFCDVTLVCSGNQQIKAHKVVISSCSPFFDQILKSNPHPHPLIYLKDVGYAILHQILDFMYCGEVTIEKEKVKPFLAAAEGLAVNGLAKFNSGDPGGKWTSLNDPPIQIQLNSNGWRHSDEPPLPGDSKVEQDAHQASPSHSSNPQPPPKRLCTRSSDEDPRKQLQPISKNDPPMDAREKVRNWLPSNDDVSNSGPALPPLSPSPYADHGESSDDKNDQLKGTGGEFLEQLAEEDINCKLCNKNFKKLNNLHRHMETVHSTKQSVCEKCGRNFKNYRTMSKHQQEVNCLLTKNE